MEKSVDLKDPTKMPKLTIKVIDGREVQKEHTEFFGGGHWLAYNWIPKYDVWIEKLESVEEMKSNLEHELIEIAQMLHGIKYDMAHNLANDFQHVLANFNGVNMIPEEEEIEGTGEEEIKYESENKLYRLVEDKHCSICGRQDTDDMFCKNCKKCFSCCRCSRPSMQIGKSPVQERTMGPDPDINIDSWIKKNFNGYGEEEMINAIVDKTGMGIIDAENLYNRIAKNYVPEGLKMIKRVYISK